MTKAGRDGLAVLAGATLWAVLWIGGTQLGQTLFPAHLVPGQPIVSLAALLGLIAFAQPLSVLAGWTAAAVAGGPGRAVRALAALQLTLGIVAETANWALMPVWYHVVFLALVVPATVWGGRLRGGSAVPAGAVVA